MQWDFQVFFIWYIAELGAGPLFKANGKIELGLGKIKGRRGRQVGRESKKKQEVNRSKT